MISLSQHKVVCSVVVKSEGDDEEGQEAAKLQLREHLMREKVSSSEKHNSLFTFTILLRDKMNCTVRFEN